MLGTREALAWLTVFALGLVVGKFIKPEMRYVVKSILQTNSTPLSQLLSAGAAVKETHQQNLQIVEDLELPSTLRCDPLEHLLVINLEGQRGARRREHIKREFARANLTGRFFFWSAVNALSDPRLAKELGKATCPCDARLSNSMSHREIYEMMLCERWPCATIFEDDVRLAPNFTLRVSETMAKRLPPFDVILWGYCPRGAKPREFEKGAGVQPLNLSYGYPGSCLHAYTISLQGAFTFIQAATPVKVPADGVLDGKHWEPWVRPHLKAGIKGSYWYSRPMMAVQSLEADASEGGS